MAPAKAILWVEIERFYIEPDEPGRAIIVVQGREVLDVNRAAESHGIRRGQSVRQARAIVGDGDFRVWCEEEFDLRSRVWLDLCLNYSSGIQPYGQHSAWLDLSLHPNPLDIAERLVRDLATATGRSIASGLAASRWIARLAAEHHDGGLAMRDPAAFLAPLPSAKLSLVSRENRDRLKFLGYPTIGAVARIPLDVLRDQFGDEGLRIQSAARAMVSDDVAPTYPPNHMVERFVFDSPIASEEAITEAGRILAAQLGIRLQTDDREAPSARLTIEFEDGTFEVRHRRFPRPMRCPATTLAAMRALLKPLPPEPVASLQVLALDLNRVRAVEVPVFGDGSSQYARLADAPLKRMQAMFGDSAIQRGCDLVLPRRLRVLQEWRHATGWR